jgi:parvulin-like peptidyl-prolyl isomerase
MEAVPPPTQEEIQAYFQDHVEEYTLPPRVKVRQTVTRTRKEAQDLARRLARGEKMEDIARQHSIAPDGERGGEMGWIVRGAMEPELEKVIFSLPVGQISPVVESSRGFYLFQVVSKHPAGAPFLPEIALEIRGRLFAERGEAFYKDWLEGLRGRFPVALDKSLLNKMEWSK